MIEKMNKKQKKETLEMFEYLFNNYDNGDLWRCLHEIPQVKDFIFTLMDDAEMIGYNMGVEFGIEYAQTQMKEPDHNQLH